MDKKTLVEPDIEAGRLLLKELQDSGVEVSAAMWLREPDDGGWHLHVASPEVRTSGPLEVYRKVDEALQRLPKHRSIDFNHVHVRSAENSFASTVTANVAPLNGDILRVRDFVVGGEEVKDAWVFRIAGQGDPELREKGSAPRKKR